MATPRPPPELIVDVVGDILLRIPPDDPAHLLRASLVCKSWFRLLTDPAFLRRYRAFHRKPPLLGFVRHKDEAAACFVPTSSFRPRYPERRRDCRVLDCRHGRVLFFDYDNGCLLLWDPVTGEDQRIPPNMEILLTGNCNAAVLCAAADCDHLGCHGGPFLVVLVGHYCPYNPEDRRTHRCGGWVYSSDAGKWSPRTTVRKRLQLRLPRTHAASPVVTGDKVYFACESGGRILCCDLQDNGGLSWFKGPRRCMEGGFALIPAEDGGLKFAGLRHCKLGLWSLKIIDPDGVPAWTQLCVIKSKLLLPTFDLMCPGPIGPPGLIGFAKGPVGDVVYVSTTAGVFTVELESHEISKVDDIDFDIDFIDEESLIIPYTSFVTPDCAVGRLSLLPQ